MRLRRRGLRNTNLETSWVKVSPCFFLTSLQVEDVTLYPETTQESTNNNKKAYSYPHSLHLSMKSDLNTHKSTTTSPKSANPTKHKSKQSIITTHR